jgi:acetylornithine deacetylase
MHNPTLTATLDILERLIAFDTTSRNSNLAMIEYIQTYLLQHDIHARLIFDANHNKANLFATIGPDQQAGICVSGHTDVVPTDGQNWTSDPYAMAIRNGKAYGRGTADMKGFIACVLAMVPEFANAALPVPLHLAFSYDEEVGCVGVRSLLASFEHESIRPLACIIGEPTRMQVAVAHKGKQSYRCKVHGKAGHSALPHLGVNAVEYAASLVAFIQKKSEQIRDSGLHNEAFIPPYSTLHTGKFRGGIALNVIPEYAEFDFEIRNIPEQKPEEIVSGIVDYAQNHLQPAMQRTHAGAGIHFDTQSAYPGLNGTGAQSLQTLCLQLSQQETTTTLSYGTEGGLFELAHIPAVVCGPGSIEQAHQADEFVELEQLKLCLQFLSGLCTHMCALLPQQ